MTNLNLIDWTMQEARQLSPEHHAPSVVDGSFDELLEALKERLKQTRTIRFLRLRMLLAFNWPTKARQNNHFLKLLPHPNRTSFPICRPRRRLRPRRTVGSIRKCLTS